MAEHTILTEDAERIERLLGRVRSARTGRVLRPNTVSRYVRAEFVAYEEGYRDAIADVVAWLLTDGRDELGDDAAARINRGDANGARHG